MWLSVKEFYAEEGLNEQNCSTLSMIFATHQHAVGESDNCSGARGGFKFKAARSKV